VFTRIGKTLFYRNIPHLNGAGVELTQLQLLNCNLFAAQLLLSCY
jgi:hypothetical protein